MTESAHPLQIEVWPINHVAKAIEIEDIEARVSELERAAGGQDLGRQK